MHATTLFKPFVTGIRFSEGPAFDADGHLYVCARRDGQIVKITPDGQKKQVIDFGGKPNGLAIDAAGQIFVADAVRKQIRTIDSHGKIAVRVPTRCGDAELIGPNDLCFGKSGTLYFTDPGLELGPRNGVIYLYDIGQKQLTCLARNLAFPNGLAVTHDEATLYFVESVTSDLRAISLTGPGSGQPQHVAHFGHNAMPDGMTWLDDQHLVVALHGTGELCLVCTKTYVRKNTSLIPGSHPTNVERKGSMLYITEDASESILCCGVDVVKDSN